VSKGPKAPSLRRHVPKCYTNPRSVSLTLDSTKSGTFLGLVRLSQTDFHCVNYIFFFFSLRPNADHGLFIFVVSKSCTTPYHTRYGSFIPVISSSQRPLPDNTHHSQQKNIHTPDGIRNNSLSRRAAADSRLIQSGHWDRHLI
jgi:hypothetical protein